MSKKPRNWDAAEVFRQSVRQNSRNEFSPPLERNGIERVEELPFTDTEDPAQQPRLNDFRRRLEREEYLKHDRT